MKDVETPLCKVTHTTEMISSDHIGQNLRVIGICDIYEN